MTYDSSLYSYSIFILYSMQIPYLKIRKQNQGYRKIERDQDSDQMCTFKLDKIDRSQNSYKVDLE